MADEDLKLSGEDETPDEDELAPIRDEAVTLQAYERFDPEVCGELEELEKNRAVVRLETTRKMSVDKEGLVHGGYIFSAANFAAMAAINNKFAVLIGSDVKFLAPLENGNVIDFEARVLQSETKKREIKVTGSVMDIKVFEGLFYVAIFDKHVLKLKLTRN